MPIRQTFSQLFKKRAPSGHLDAVDGRKGKGAVATSRAGPTSPGIIPIHQPPKATHTSKELYENYLQWHEQLVTATTTYKYLRTRLNGCTLLESTSGAPAVTGYLKYANTWLHDAQVILIELRAHFDDKVPEKHSELRFGTPQGLRSSQVGFVASERTARLTYPAGGRQQSNEL
jgi:hypothetical protein